MLDSVRRGLLLLLCALALSPPLAAAQEDEVFVDPGSPSGKEYALPIDRARQEGSTARQEQRPASRQRKPPLFGEGVEGATTPATPSSPPKATRTRSNTPSKRAKDHAEADRRAKAVAREKPAAAAEARSAELARTRAAAPEGGVGVAAIVGAGLSVLLVGGLAGLWLRRRTAP